MARRWKTGDSRSARPPRSDCLRRRRAPASRWPTTRFGIGSASKFTWEGLAFLSWRLGEHWSVAAGYRGIGLDRSSSDLSSDIALHGPLIGFVRAF